MGWCASRKCVRGVGVTWGTYFRMGRGRPGSGIASTRCRCRSLKRGRRCRMCSGVEFLKGRLTKASSQVNAGAGPADVGAGPRVNGRPRGRRHPAACCRRWASARALRRAGARAVSMAQRALPEPPPVSTQTTRRDPSTRQPASNPPNAAATARLAVRTCSCFPCESSRPSTWKKDGRPQ